MEGEMTRLEQFTTANPPQDGERVWVLSVGDLPQERIWCVARPYSMLLTEGRVHRTRQSAEMHRRARDRADSLLQAVFDALPVIEREADLRSVAVIDALLREIRGKEVTG
jgi:hypothetical protein